VDARKSIIQMLLGGLLLTAAAATSAQNDTLQRLIPVEGRVAPDEAQTWTFQAASGEVLSFFGKDISGGFDPVITILNNAGEELVANDDYNQPSNGDALLEAVTFPFTGTYRASVSGFNGEAGSYRLTMLPGFSQVEISYNFNGNRTWEALSEPLEVNATDDTLGLSLEGTRLRGIAVDPRADTPQNYFAQVEVNASGGADGWSVGLATRIQNADQYYILNLNSLGQWRFLLHQAEGDQVIRDWTPHPAIVPDKATFTLGILVNDVGYDFFYDGQLFGRLSDATLPDDGDFGLAVETLGSPTSQTTALFDNLVITIPTLVNNQLILPEQLVIGTPSDTVQELQRRSLIPGGGEMGMIVNESFVESQRPGVERLMLGRGATYQDFAMGTLVSWQVASAGTTGCGLVLRTVDDTNYTLAFIDQMGGYGLSQREGDTFQPGIFGEIVNFQAGTHHLLVIARDEILYYYVDGQYKGTLENSPVEGTVGDAVVNFDPISTSCTFNETWVWHWEEN
jgi:hypothetical protein